MHRDIEEATVLPGTFYLIDLKNLSKSNLVERVVRDHCQENNIYSVVGSRIRESTITTSGLLYHTTHSPTDINYFPLAYYYFKDEDLLYKIIKRHIKDGHRHINFYEAAIV